ncbi:hypothetical protein C8R47DRAFT_1144619 [Mycena vitilis]|nr:hypothetical protein C8R47DRAFT_1144619 [Mycena vitilis]
MPTSMFHLLFCSCARPRDEEDLTVIPTETTHLLSTALSSPGLPEATAVDHQKLQDRMGSIVRSKEGKMVNVSARTPFTLQSAPAPLGMGALSQEASSDTDSATSSAHAPARTAYVSRRPPVLTMTPAHARLHADSRYSSPTGSRSSSRRRTDPGSYGGYGGYAHSAAARVPSDWFGDSGSESASIKTGDEEPTPTPHASGPRSPSPIPVIKDEDKNTMSIAFSWGET